MTASQSKGAFPSRNENAPRQASYLSAASQASEPLEPNRDAERLQSLRLQLARHNLEVATTAGTDLIVTGPGTCALVDPRTAWLLMRSLNRGWA